MESFPLNSLIPLKEINLTLSARNFYSTFIILSIQAAAKVNKLSRRKLDIRALRNVSSPMSVVKENKDRKEKNNPGTDHSNNLKAKHNGKS